MGGALFRSAGLGALVLLLATFSDDLAARPRSAATGGAEKFQVGLPQRTVITRHKLDVAGRVLAFTAVAGSMPIAGANGRVEAETAFIAFIADGVEQSARPVTFVMNGGPGAASAYLNLGALGPWRVRLQPNPSARPPLLPNAETWLDFSDLVFIDPPGTGLGRLLSKSTDARERHWSVAGDVEALAGIIARWLQANHRLASPAILLGQSYGGYRAPRIASQLRGRHGIGVSALVLLSPELDYGWAGHAATSPLSFAALLPSMAATRLDKEGRLDPAQLRPIEDYARSEFVADFLRGPADAEAVERIIGRVAAISGLPAELVRASKGRIDAETYQREMARERGTLASSYDATVAKPVPDPTRPAVDVADPFLESLKAPLTAAMVDLLHSKLKVRTTGQYELTNEQVFAAWNWGSDGELPEAVTALRELLALDQSLAVLVAHGYSDLETPYFQTHLILDQVAEQVRIVRRTYAGGHMFYDRDDSRAAFRADAEELYRTLTKR
jgi:carboxypeptidase C (cathepsin A)